MLKFKRKFRRQRVNKLEVNVKIFLVKTIIFLATITTKLRRTYLVKYQLYAVEGFVFCLVGPLCEIGRVTIRVVWKRTGAPADGRYQLQTRVSGALFPTSGLGRRMYWQCFIHPHFNCGCTVWVHLMTLKF